MTRIKIWKVITDRYDDDYELAVCSKLEYAERAIERIVSETCYVEEELFIVESAVILDVCRELSGRSKFLDVED